MNCSLNGFCCGNRAEKYHPSELLSEEWALVATAVEQRRREFAAGRLLARRLVKSFGHSGPLGRQPDGLPDWPPGIVGSITHCVSLAAVAIGSAADCSGIGIDVEVNKPMPEGVPKLILTEEERSWSEAGHVTALQIFCAKEALDKAIYRSAKDLLSLTQWSSSRRSRARLYGILA